MLLFVYTTTCKGFVIFTCRYFKFSWNITALSQSNCRNFSCSGINCQRVSRYIKSHYFSRLIISRTSVSWRIYKVEKPVDIFSTLTLDITRPYNLLISENISKCYTCERTRQPRKISKTQQLISIYTEVIYLNSWIKFPLTNRQTSKALKFNHQQSKLEKNPSTVKAATPMGCSYKV